MAHLVLEGLAKTFGPTVALAGMDLAVAKGDLVTLLGPSGCGKTTALRLIAGFTAATHGRILIDGGDVTHMPPHRRDVGMVFQSYALFPHLTVAANIAFGLEERGLPGARVRTRVNELLDLIRLAHVAERLPAELSGGQQQRVALARAVAYEPRLLLMDEPLAALDLKLREAMQAEIRRVQRELRITTLYVTHDQTEAMRISDRIVVMNAGRIEQQGTASEIYEMPTSRFVADFIGRINLLDARVVGVASNETTLQTSFGAIRLPLQCRMPQGAPATIGIRPDDIAIDPGAGDDVTVVQGTVIECVYLGSATELQVRLDAGPTLLAESRPAFRRLVPGQRVRVGLPASRCKLLPQ